MVSVSAQISNKIWQKKAASEFDDGAKIERRTTPTKFEVFNLNVNELKENLLNSPKRKAEKVTSNTVLGFPNIDGVLEDYEVFEASIMEESLQNKFPNIKSYIGKSVDNPDKTIRFSVSKIGLHAMIMQSEAGQVYIDPYTSNKESYIVYSKKNLPKSGSFECDVIEENTDSKNAISAKSTNANDGKLRTFRLAIATTGEYSQFQLVYNGVSANATDTEKKETVLSAINATMTRVNAIFERDVSLTMELVANNLDIIFLDPDTDGFTNGDGSELIDESQTVIDANIGFSNYDIGHTFSTGGGGLATVGSPCTSSKAKGITGSSFPIGDTYDIDFVAHEMGHQYGAYHTFNSGEGGCSGNRSSTHSVEPGSGSTIMAYAGLCAPENVQQQSDDYFHLVSVQQMWDNISDGNSTCATYTDTGNSVPVLADLPNYTLPISTPFVLSAEATDSDNDELTYTWEQLDTEIAVAPPVASATGGPSFRSVAPSNSPMRYFPDKNTVSAGNLSNTWEVLPSVSRTMKFGVNVRDNNINGGQTASKETELTFDETAGPFEVTSQSVIENWIPGETKTITWDVSNTDTAPVNCSNVNILFSTDGGYTFPYTLATNILNNGIATINVPNITTALGRVKVQSVGNIFYALNEASISIQAKEFTLSFTEDELKVCKTEDAVYNFTYNTFLGFDEVTNFTATGNPAGTTVSFSPSSATSNNTNIVVTVSGINTLDSGNYTFNVVGTSETTSLEKIQELVLNVFDATISAPTLINPSNNAIDILKPYTLNWSLDENAETYEVQIATDADFSTIIDATIGSSNSFQSNLLKTNTVYYWRVKAVNSCGESSYSTVFNFTTASEVCSSYDSIDIPKSISIGDPNTVSSTLNVVDDKLISNVNVTVDITHTWVSDLTLELTSPNGISILLSVGNGGNGNNYTNTVFDDSATESIVDGIAPFTGTYSPQLPLSYLKSTKAKGQWILEIIDSESGDGGALNSWGIEICGIPLESNDDDNDGVANDIDKCPNTAFGNSVDDLGCFKFPNDNFEIETTGTSCPDKENGQIKITAEKDYDYTAEINGSTYDFTSSSGLTLSSLAAGTYDLCISVFVEDENETYKQCYNLTIDAASIIAGKTTVSNSKALVAISEGTAPYNIYVNEKSIFTTSSNSFSVDVNHGDILEIKSSVECEGVLSKQIDFISEIIAYPNPSNGIFQITIPIAENEVKIELFNMQSQLISSKSYPIKSGKVQLDIEDKPTGLYIVKVYLDTKSAVFKVIKQ